MENFLHVQILLKILKRSREIFAISDQLFVGYGIFDLKSRLEIASF